MKKLWKLFLVLALCIGILAGCSGNTGTDVTVCPDNNVGITKPVATEEDYNVPAETETGTIAQTPEETETVNTPHIPEETVAPAVNKDSIPAYSGSPFAVINSNVPYFTNKEITDNSYEYYSELDNLGRCGVTIACIGKDIMPTEARGEIGSVKPTGWHTVKYDCVDGKYLYNRCHLIGFQLTGENANVKNLITGTRYLNVIGMLPFENMVADYVKETGNHVMYRVTPMFDGDNLVANGVLMEALSVEDNGAGIQFCVFCYNVQPGIIIDYLTGESSAADSQLPTETPTEVPAETVTEKPDDNTQQYMLNTNTGKFHKMNCSYIEKMKEEHKQIVESTHDEMIENGYEPCKKCNP